MAPLDYLWLLFAGLGGGLTGSVAGLASLVSYPALLAVGMGPVSANVTNTVSLIFSSVGAVSGSRPELTGQRSRARRLALFAFAGGLTGSALLLVTPSGDFARIVPFFIGGASFAMLARSRAEQNAPPASPSPGWRLNAAVLAVTIYGGYFGAAAGVLLLVILLFSTGETLARANAMKNVLVGLTNAVAAIGFAAFGPVHWLAVLPLGAGSLIGGRLGPRVVRRAPTRVLRVLIACGGLALAVHLGLNAFG
ncbi:MAG: sulfite exporter TauE/SafE family protein [Actinomycetota bacterium]|nr:sulfite exporter TauE/SafE family protein [Actinomycetota bacterium]